MNISVEQYNQVVTGFGTQAELQRSLMEEIIAELRVSEKRVEDLRKYVESIAQEKAAKDEGIRVLSRKLAWCALVARNPGAVSTGGIVVPPEFESDALVAVRGLVARMALAELAEDTWKAQAKVASRGKAKKVK